MGEERLARMVSQGSERAFAAIYARYHQSLYRYSRSIVGEDADAQDVLQSTFASAFQALRGGSRDAPLRPWLFRIAHNEAVSLLRRRRPAAEFSDAVEVGGPSAHEQALERERLAMLMADLAQLGDRQRSALVMRELSGLSHKEIALALDTSLSGAKQAIFEARRTLHEFVEGRAMACEQIRKAISHEDRRLLRARRVRAHLRHCPACRSFAAEIPARRADLRAIAPPLAPLAVSLLAQRVLTAGSHHGPGSSLTAAGATGKSVAAALAGKAAIGAAILATATVGVAHVLAPAKHPAAQHARSSGAHAQHAGASALRRGHARGHARAPRSPASARSSNRGLGALSSIVASQRHAAAQRGHGSRGMSRSAEEAVQSHGRPAANAHGRSGARVEHLAGAPQRRSGGSSLTHRHSSTSGGSLANGRSRGTGRHSGSVETTTAPHGAGAPTLTQQATSPPPARVSPPAVAVERAQTSP